jgi:hypothetical protein
MLSTLRAEALNDGCLCTRSNFEELQAILGDGGFSDPEGRPTTNASLFAEFPVFVSDDDVQKMSELVTAVQKTVENPEFAAHALSSAPAIARVNSGTRGLVFGYDFHLAESGPKLIEVNTNAGGLLLNHALRRVQEPCCDAVAPLLRSPLPDDDLEHSLVQSFRQEFERVQGSDAPLEFLAIVDDQPQSQFLFPEFQLFKHLFRRAGIDACIVDPMELTRERGAIWYRGTKVDLIYNRLTDFYLEQPSNQHLANAYVGNEVVITPNPRAHALYANKSHLALWSNVEQLRAWHVDEQTIATLSRIVPHASIVRPENRNELWNTRRRYFFKPPCGFAGKAAYRGDKISRSTWDQHVTTGYIAQEIVKPSERLVRFDGQEFKLKLDVRAYVNQERIQLLAARLYQGQTTNFRTPGGGFATVLALPVAP